MTHAVECTILAVQEKRTLTQSDNCSVVECKNYFFFQVEISSWEWYGSLFHNTCNACTDELCLDLEKDDEVDAGLLPAPSASRECYAWEPGDVVRSRVAMAEPLPLYLAERFSDALNNPRKLDSAKDQDPQPQSVSSIVPVAKQVASSTCTKPAPFKQRQLNTPSVQKGYDPKWCADSAMFLDRRIDCATPKQVENATGKKLRISFLSHVTFSECEADAAVKPLAGSSFSTSAQNFMVLIWNTSRLDKNYGFPDKELPERMVEEVKEIYKVNTWPAFFERVRFPQGVGFGKEKFSDMLRDAMKTSAARRYYNPSPVNRLSQLRTH
ncbi:hypothetical protein B0H13DRAFT_1906552 [Mycena leptocephala]|nr:hypothetical protein B0H13DRAFT_1906552 [Mycena leptocephala]